MEKDRPTMRQVHVPAAASALSKPWTAQAPPAVAANWTDREKKRCIAAANAVIARNPNDERGAIFACIRAAGRSNKLFKADGVEKPLSVIEKEHDGVMVALFVPKAAAEKLVIKGGLPPEELHITMAYLGRRTDEYLDVDEVRAAVKEAAGKSPPLSGHVGGKIRFENPGKAEAAFCAVPDVPGIDRLRTALVDALERRGIRLQSEHGFNPHVTLKYVGMNGRDPVKRVQPVPVRFDRLTLAWGGEKTEFPLKGKVKKMDDETLLQVNGDQVTLGDLARAWLEKAERFTSAPWSEPSANLSADDYCSVCLIDENPAGRDKVKNLCKLPVRARPGAPANTNALRAVAGSLGGSRGQEVKAKPESKLKAARELVRLMRAADMEPSEPTLRRAGMTKSDFEVEFAIVKADEPRRVVYGVPLRPDATDSQGDRVSADEIREAAWEFMVKSQRYDEQHKRLVPEGDVAVVESFLAPVDFKLGDVAVKEGSWVLASKIFSDDLWEKIQKGEINAYSIKGRGKRSPA